MAENTEHNLLAFEYALLVIVTALTAFALGMTAIKFDQVINGTPWEMPAAVMVTSIIGIGAYTTWFVSILRRISDLCAEARSKGKTLQAG